jgi:hypothetical protein
MVANATPVVIGERAVDLVEQYASVVAAGRLHWIPVGSSLLEAQDLLGRFDPSIRRLVPHAAGLLDVLQDATKSRRMHVVVLDGFNRAPVEAYLLPILQAAAAARRGDCTGVLSLASPAVLSETDPYYDVGRIVWPETVLLACVPTHGATTLPVSADVWRHLSVIDADGRERPALPSAASTQEASRNTEVPRDLWIRLSTVDQTGLETKPKQTIERIASAWKLGTGDASMAKTVYFALRRNGLAEAESIALAVTSTLVPRTDVGDRAVEESLKASGITAIGWKVIQSEAERLRS